MSFPLGQPDGGLPPDRTKEPMTLSELLGGTSFVSATGRTYRLFGNEDKSLALPTIPAIPPILTASKTSAAVTLEEALQQIESFSQPGVSEKVREQPVADPPTLQLFQTLGEPAPRKLAKKENTVPNASFSVKDILDEVSQSSPKQQEKRAPLRVIPEHVEEPFIVPFAKPELPPEEKFEAKNVVLKIVSDFVPEIYLQKTLRKCWNHRRKEKTSYRKPFSVPPIPRTDNESRECNAVERPDEPAIDPGTPAIASVPGSHVMPEKPMIVNEPKPDIDPSTFQWSAQLDSLKQTASNQTRMLTDHLIVQSNQGTKVICFKSIFPGDGCSTILLCAARTLSERNYRILLIDAHHRHVDLPKHLNLSGNLDLGNEVISLNNRLGLWVWQESKTAEENRTTLAEVITAHREKYDLILLDDGSVTESPLTEFVEFWNHVALDGVILVSNTKRSAEIPVSHIAGRFRQNHIHLIGVTENYV